VRAARVLLQRGVARLQPQLRAQGRCRLLDRLARHIVFRRMPGLRRLHEEEIDGLAASPVAELEQLAELS